MRKLTALLLLSACATGCAQVAVRKVPAPAQYVINGRSEWTAEMQRRADEMEGLRFYLPRPFVSVFESFPVATDVYLARGRVSPDGRYVAIDSVARFGGEGLLGPPINVGPSLTVPQDWLFRASDPDRPLGSSRSGDIPPGEAGDLRGALAAAGAAGDAKGSAEEAADSAQRARRSAAEATAAAPDRPATGISRRGVSNSNGAFAYQPLRGSFDIVYLPDFDEQYVVSSRAGLGNAEFQLNLGQGWSLQGFNSLTDNSELNKRIFDVIDAGIELAKKSASGALAMVFPPAAAGLLGTPRAGEVAPAQAPGTAVALKIVVVHYAARGLYPVVKPRELMDRAAPGLVINLADDRGAVRLTDSEVREEVDRFNRLQRRFTVPVYPYQYVSFNTFQYAAIEVLSPGGSPFGTLYDKTGTTGPAGGSRESDEALTKLIRELASMQPGTPPIGEPDRQPAPAGTAPDALAEILKALESHEALSAAKRDLPTGVNVERVRLEATSVRTNVRATVTLTGGSKTLADDQVKPMQERIRAALNASQALRKALGDKEVAAVQVFLGGT